MTRTLEQLQKRYDAFLIAHDLPDTDADELLYQFERGELFGLSHIQRAGLCEWLLRFKRDWRDAQ
jgi:hypothetical protein